MVEAMGMDMFFRVKCFGRAGKKIKVLMRPLTSRGLRTKIFEVPGE